MFGAMGGSMFMNMFGGGGQGGGGGDAHASTGMPNMNPGAPNMMGTVTPRGNDGPASISGSSMAGSMNN